MDRGGLPDGSDSAVKPGAGRRPVPGSPSRLHTIPRDTLLAFLGLLGVFGVCVYLPLGLVAVAAQDGLNDTLRKGLGSVGEAPFPFRIVQAMNLQWPLGVGAGALIALLHASLRRARRPDVAFGDDLAWDGVRSPLFVLLAAGAAGSVGLAWLGGRSLWGDAAVVTAAVLLLTVVASLAVGLCSRFRGLRLTLAAFALLALGFRIGADVWGRARLAAFDEQTAPEMAAERKRREALERPLLRGEPLDEDAAPRYRKIFDTLRSRKDAADSYEMLKNLQAGGALAPLPEGARLLLDTSRDEISGLREAVRCRRCLLGLDFDPAAISERPIYDPVRRSTLLLAIDGRERALQGDLRGAAERYLDLVRFGGDLGEGPLINGLLGNSAQETGLRALGRVVLTGRLDRALLEQIEAERALLEPTRVSLATGLRSHRFLLTHVDDTLARSPIDAGLSDPLPLRWIVPYRAVAAHALAVGVPVLRQLEEALAADDAEAWKRAVAAADTAGASSLNPMLRGLTGHSRPLGGEGYGDSRLFSEGRRGLTWFRLVRAAVLVERQRLAAGRLPRDTKALDLPADPFAPLRGEPLAPGSLLRYAATGDTYKIWSVGVDGKDDGGIADKETDIVLDRR